MTKNHTINTIKAVLILFVILWHLMSGQNTFTRSIITFIATFTMPLFFGVSGFLLKKELFFKPFLQFLYKYFHRLIVPFIFAYLIFSLVQGQFISLLYPWFHLWFIPAFLFILILIYVFEHMHINKFITLILSASFTLLYLSFFREGPNEEFLYYLGDKHYYYEFVFLYFGYFIRNYSEKFQLSTWKFLIIFILSALYLFLFNEQKSANFVCSLTSLSFNLSLIFLTINFAKHFTNIKIPIISTLGEITLPIYLLHVLPLLLMWKLRDVYYIHGVFFIGLFFVLLTILIYLILKTKDTKFTKIFITGQQN